MTLGGNFMAMSSLPKCKSCGTSYPQARATLGYKVCVTCSTEERWSAIPVTYHKTGNTIEVVKDPAEAATITAMMHRTGFGLMRGMKGFKINVHTGDGKIPISVASTEPQPVKPPTFSGKEIARRKMPLDYEGVGLQMMEALEQQGKKAAIEVVELAEKSWKILPSQAVQLRYIIDTLGS